MENLTERLDKHLQSIREALNVKAFKEYQNKVINFLSGRFGEDAEEVVEEAIETIEHSEFSTNYHESAANLVIIATYQSLIPGIVIDNNYKQKVINNWVKYVDNIYKTTKVKDYIKDREELESQDIYSEVLKMAKKQKIDPMLVCVEREENYWMDRSYTYGILDFMETLHSSVHNKISNEYLKLVKSKVTNNLLKFVDGIVNLEY